MVIKADISKVSIWIYNKKNYSVKLEETVNGLYLKFHKSTCLPLRSPMRMNLIRRHE